MHSWSGGVLTVRYLSIDAFLGNAGLGHYPWRGKLDSSFRFCINLYKYEIDVAGSHKSLHKRTKITWDKYQQFMAKKNLDLALLEVEMAQHKADLQQLWAERGPDGQPLMTRDTFTLDLEAKIAKDDLAIAQHKAELAETEAELDSLMKKIPASEAKIGDGIIPSKLQKHKKIAASLLKRKISELRKTCFRAKEVCMELDKLLENERRGIPYRPLPSWQRKADGKRTWTELFEQPSTHNAVKTYINKILPSQY